MCLPQTVIQHIFTNRLLVPLMLFALLFSSLSALEAKDKNTPGKKTITAEKVKKKWAKLQKKVAAGKITKEKALEKISALKKQLHSNNNSAAKKDLTDAAEARLKYAWKKLQAEVAAGKITEKEAHAKMAALKKSVAVYRANQAKRGQSNSDSKKKTYDLTKKKDSKSASDDYATNIWKKLQAAVKADILTQREAYILIGSLKQSIAAKKKVNHDEAALDRYLKTTWTQLQAAVKAGKITQAEAITKMTAIKKAKGLIGNKNKAKNDAAKSASDKAALERYLKTTWAQLQAAVKAGKMSQAQANAKMRAIKKAKGLIK